MSESQQQTDRKIPEPLQKDLGMIDAMLARAPGTRDEHVIVMDALRRVGTAALEGFALQKPPGESAAK